MALEAVVYSYYNPCKDFYSLLTEGGGYDQYLFQEEDKPLLGLHENSSFRDGKESWDHSLYSSPEVCTATVDQSVHGVSGGFSLMEPRVRPETAAAGGRRKRRRTKSTKNKEEIENQRMTHIAVERNRRKQMNEFLAVLRSLMPPSYVQRGDQASIIGGAINFVKELEQLLQSMEAHKRTSNGVSPAVPFADFFTFPQYSTCTAATECSAAVNSPCVSAKNAAEIEVSMIESHANVKILSKKRPRQLLTIVAEFQRLKLSILHLNVTTTFDEMVLYSISIKVEEGCQFNTADDIAAGVNNMLCRIQEEAALELSGRLITIS